VHYQLKLTTTKQLIQTNVMHQNYITQSCNHYR